MGRSPCCAKEGLNRGAWTATEDRVLTDYIKLHGEGKWRNLPKIAGLKRCGKSCRLRWLNYLKPDIKRGNITVDEEELIVRLHKLLGNRWSLIAGRLPGRTDNEIKNYWNTKIGKKLKSNKEYLQIANPSQDAPKKGHQNQREEKPNATIHRSTGTVVASPIRTKASRCSTVIVPPELLHDGRVKQQFGHDIKSMVVPNLPPNSMMSAGNSMFNNKSLPAALEEDISSDFLLDFDVNEQFLTDILNMDFSVRVDNNFANGASSSGDDSSTCDQVGILSPSSNSGQCRTFFASDDMLLHDDLDFPTVACINDDEAGLELEWLQD